MKEDVLQNAYEILKDQALFRNIAPEALKSILGECQLVTWKKAETIGGDITSKYLHVIIKGRLKITQIDPHSARTIALFVLSSGDIFDIFTLLDGKEHVVFPIAVDEVLTLRIPLKRAREWICEHPEFNKAFLPYLGEKMRELEAFGESVVFHDTATRLANLILKHVMPQEISKESHHSLKLISSFSHESLAEMIGSVRSVVSSQMHKLKEEEIIFNKRGHLAIKNLEELMKKCDLYEHFINEKQLHKKDIL